MDSCYSVRECFKGLNELIRDFKCAKWIEKDLILPRKCLNSFEQCLQVLKHALLLKTFGSLPMLNVPVIRYPFSPSNPLFNLVIVFL